MKPEPIYLDHAATTPVRDEVLEAMKPFFGARFGNPSSVHRWGREARAALDEARERVAQCLGARPDEVCFTSGGTEGDNLAILGAWRCPEGKDATRSSPRRSSTRRSSAPCTRPRPKAPRSACSRSTSDGVVDRRAHSIGSCDDDVAVCIGHVGEQRDRHDSAVPELAEQAKAKGVVFHTDAVQAFGKVHDRRATQPFDLLSISGHKIGAPKGIGAMYIRRGTPLEPLLHGGSQDRGRRPGTENVAYAVGLARAAELTVAERETECAAASSACATVSRQRFSSAFPTRSSTARGANRAPHIINVSVPGTDSESMLMALDLRGIAASGGSACQSGSIEPSHVLIAIGVAPELASAAMRMSFGCLTTDDVRRPRGRGLPCARAEGAPARRRGLSR